MFICKYLVLRSSPNHAGHNKERHLLHRGPDTIKKDLQLVTSSILNLETFSQMLRTKISTHAGTFSSTFSYGRFLSKD